MHKLSLPQHRRTAQSNRRVRRTATGAGRPSAAAAAARTAAHTSCAHQPAPYLVSVDADAASAEELVGLVEDSARQQNSPLSTGGILADGPHLWHIRNTQSCLLLSLLKEVMTPLVCCDSCVFFRVLDRRCIRDSKKLQKTTYIVVVFYSTHPRTLLKKLHARDVDLRVGAAVRHGIGP